MKRIILASLGVFLLLPGLCSAATMLITVPWTIDSFIRPEKYPNMHASVLIFWPLLWGVCFLIGWCGLKLLRRSKKSGLQE